MTSLDKTSNNNTGIYSPADGVTMFQADWRPAYLSLVQNTSAVGTAGRLRRTDTEAEYDILDVVPLAVQAQRTYWGGGEFVRGRTPVCRSSDGIVADDLMPDGTSTQFAGRACKSCEFRSDNPFERGDICQAGYLAAFYSLETDEAFLMRLNGSATRIARVIGNAGTIRQKTVTLYSAEVVTANGRFWGLRAGGGEALNAEQRDVIEGIYRDSPLARQGFGGEDVHASPPQAVSVTAPSRPVPPQPVRAAPAPEPVAPAPVAPAPVAPVVPEQTSLEADLADTEKLPW